MPITTKEAKICAVCSTSILSGSIARPVVALDGAKRIDFAHVDCLPANDERVPVCKHWRAKGVCVYESSCMFRHPEDYKLSTDRARTRHGTWMRRRIFNEGRCGVLRRWLVEIFGYEYLRSGSGIVDVAGGKGELSFEFVNLSRIPSTVFDPRPLELNRYRRKLDFGFYHSNDVLGAYNIGPRPKGFEEHIIPKHIRLFFEMPFPRPLSERKDALCGLCDDPSIQRADANTDYEGISKDDYHDGYKLPLALHSEAEYLAARALAGTIAWTNKGLTHEEQDDGDGDACNRGDIPLFEKEIYDSSAPIASHVYPPATPSCSVATDDGSVSVGCNEVSDYSAVINTLRDCSMLVGMHPDQAVEHIVEFGLRNRKPFAVVPCCVYHKQFPHRKKSDGGYVKTYAELIEHLLSKSSDIIPIELDFEGKNVMLFYPGRFAVRRGSGDSNRGHDASYSDPFNCDRIADTHISACHSSTVDTPGDMPTLQGDVYMTRPLFSRGVASARVWEKLSGNDPLK